MEAEIKTDEFRITQLEERVKNLEGLETNDSTWIRDFKLSWKIIWGLIFALWSLVISIAYYLLIHHVNVVRLGRILTK